MPSPTARLQIYCPDLPGIVATVSGFLYNHGANIIALDQYSAEQNEGNNEFFMRVEFETPQMDVTLDGLRQAFSTVVAERFAMNWSINLASDLPKVAIFVSKTDHCLQELLWRWSRGELPCEIHQVISNHDTLRADVERFGVPFHHIPVTADNKIDAEAQQLALLENQTDLIVLARYMQILSPTMVSRYPNQIINIHHSFLPAFIGADPYRQASQRGVKLIGATAHYVTETLDEGPIIEQDVARVSHRDQLATLKQLGAELERRALSRAVRWHLEQRVVVHGNRTVVFQ